MAVIQRVLTGTRQPPTGWVFTCTTHPYDLGMVHSPTYSLSILLFVGCVTWELADSHNSHSKVTLNWTRNLNWTWEVAWPEQALNILQAGAVGKLDQLPWMNEIDFHSFTAPVSFQVPATREWNFLHSLSFLPQNISFFHFNSNFIPSQQPHHFRVQCTFINKWNSRKK